VQVKKIFCLFFLLATIGSSNIGFAGTNETENPELQELKQQMLELKRQMNEIGISYAITAAATMFLIGIAPGHAHAEEMLAGKLLWVTWQHIVLCLVVFTAVAFCLHIFRKPLFRISEDYEGAITQGLKVIWWDFVFYTLLGVVITVAVRVTGVVTVFSFLIIPATISALFSAHWGLRMIIAWTAATVASLGGLLFAYFFDFSLGPAIALFLGVVLVIAALLAKYNDVIRQVWNYTWKNISRILP